MKQCTLYVSIGEHQKVLDAIGQAFREQAVETSADGRSVTAVDRRWFGKRSITFNIMREDADPDEFVQMKRGMYGYVYQIETGHEQVKQKLLLQITALNVAVGIVASHELDPKTIESILEMAEAVHGIVFLPNGNTLDSQGRLILSPDGDSELEDFRVTVSSDLIDGHIKPSKSGEERKERSLKLLEERGIPSIRHLPVIVGDEDAVLRTKEEVVQRAIALCLIAVYAGGVAEGGDVQEEREFIEGIIEQYGAASFFTEKEKAFLQDAQPDRTAAIQMVWMYECYWVLLWALGYKEELEFPGQICDVNAAIDVLKQAGDYATFLEGAVLRSKEEILDQADLIYRYDWACVDARIHDRTVAGGLDGGVVMERHRALNWLICYMEDDWDHVQMDT